MRKGRLLIVTVGLVASVLLVIAACGGAAATSTPGPDATSANSGGALPSPGETPKSGEPTQEPAAGEPSVPGAVSSGVMPPASVPRSEVSSAGPASSTAQGSGSVAYPSIQYGASQQVGIWVTGRGEVTANPDLVILNAGVEARARTVAEARDQAAQAMDQMIQVLTDRGIETGDIQTRFFNISPEYVWNEGRRRQELVGFIVNNQVAVKIRDVGSVGLVIDELAEAGGDLVRIQGVRFTVEDTDELETQARTLAVQALMAKAQQFAQLTNVQLGKPVFLSESGGFAPRIQNFAEAAIAKAPVADQARSTPISGGELTVTIIVQGTFSIIE